MGRSCGHNVFLGCCVLAILGLCAGAVVWVTWLTQNVGLNDQVGEEMHAMKNQVAIDTREYLGNYQHTHGIYSGSLGGITGTLCGAFFATTGFTHLLLYKKGDYVANRWITASYVISVLFIVIALIGTGSSYYFKFEEKNHFNAFFAYTLKELVYVTVGLLLFCAIGGSYMRFKPAQEEDPEDNILTKPQLSVPVQPSSTDSTRKPASTKSKSDRNRCSKGGEAKKGLKECSHRNMGGYSPEQMGKKHPRKSRGRHTRRDQVKPRDSVTKPRSNGKKRKMTAKSRLQKGEAGVGATLVRR